MFLCLKNMVRQHAIILSFILTIENDRDDMSEFASASPRVGEGGRLRRGVTFSKWNVLVHAILRIGAACAHLIVDKVDLNGLSVDTVPIGVDV